MTDHSPVLALDDAAAAIASARRTAAERGPATAIEAQWRPLAALAPIAAQWRALAARALEPNVFYEPAFALAAAPVLGRDVGAVLVWSKTTPPELIGFFPARIERRRYGVPLPVLVGWTHPYGPYGMPLVDRDAAQVAIVAWLYHIARNPQLPKRVMLPFLRTDGPFAAALDAILARSRLPAEDFNRHRRAMLAPDTEATVAPDADPLATRSDYLIRAIPARKLKELRRQRRRLVGQGTLTLATARGVFAIEEALADFLALEAGGWKGRAGTAAAHHHDVRQVIGKAVRELATEGKVRIDRLVLGDRAIAAAITLKSGDGAFFWKIAYDEAFARSSPGVLLAVELTEMLLFDPDITRVDSCAVADHPMIDSIWRERLSLADRLIAVAPDRGLTFACRLERLRRATITAAKGARDFLGNARRALT